jgi:hypothetical protein
VATAHAPGMLTFTPDVPGRGSWTLTGGLLPLRPNAASTVGYYRAPAITEAAPGFSYIIGNDRSDSAYCVHLGVKAVQRLAGMGGREVDGWLGPKTDQRIRAAQRSAGVTVDGIVGRTTMHAWLTPLITTVATASGIPVPILGGLVAHESGFDPAAVGVNGLDHGLVQINLSAHPDVTVADALDPSYAIAWAAHDLAAVHQRWLGHTQVDPWDVAVLHHNSPAWAQQLAMTGQYATKAGCDYVTAVRSAW